MRLQTMPVPLSAARRVLGARSRILNLADAALPGEAALLTEVVFGMQRTKIAGVLASSGLADALGLVPITSTATYGRAQGFE